MILGVEAGFLEADSPDAQLVQEVLTSGDHRCNMMMVLDADQAVAILRQDSAETAPDLLLVFGGLDDGRALKLLERLASEPRLNRLGRVVLVDTIAARDEAARRSGPSLRLAELSRAELQDWIAARRNLWWAMARFS